MAKFIAEDQPVCYSRQIGCVIVDPVLNQIVSSGYNGSPQGLPNSDSEEFLRDYLWPKLTDDELQYIAHSKNINFLTQQSFCDTMSGCKQCPRKMLGLKSGEKRDYCLCECAERNAIYNSSRADLNGCSLFLWTDIMPCTDCSRAIIRKRIKRIYKLGKENGQMSQKDLQSAQSMLQWAEVNVYTYSSEWILN